jgi:hypothetical protein
MALRKYGRFGGYLSPVVVMGTFVPCDVRGIVRVVSMSAGPIAWPIGEKDGQRSLIIFKGLARALQKESAERIAAWWGIDQAIVRRWQAGERVPLVAERWTHSGDVPAADDPEDRRKAWQVDDDAPDSAALPPPPATSPPATSPPATAWPKSWHPPVVDGDAHAAEFSRKRRWEPWEDDLVRTCTVEEVVRQTKRKPAAVWARRYRLGVSAPRTSRV